MALVGSICVAMLLCGAGSAATAGSVLEASQDDMKWWREARFGLFVHWGPVSLKGMEISWSRGGDRPGCSATAATGPIPVEEYDNLYKEFNPVEFDAREWVAMAQDAGMKYLVFTTKHHAGFCMFDSKLTDYTIMNSPFGRDILAELAEACHEAGLGLGFYYSPPDWHHPDCLTENHSRYVEYLHGQLRELCTNYGKVDIIWFDGLSGKAEDWQSEGLFGMIRGLQPDVLINNRAGLPGDFGTPEQTVGGFDRDRPWESCITIGTQWAWKPNDRTKSLEECIRTLVMCAGGDGNLLLNVGPAASGTIEPDQVERLREIGAWLNRYGESIYGTRGGPFMPTLWCASTNAGNTVYLHVFDWDGPGLALAPIDKAIVSARVLTGGTVEFEQSDEGIKIVVPSEHRDAIDTIVALELDGPAIDVAPREVTRSLTYGKAVRTSNVHKGEEKYDGARAVDGNRRTRWATDGGTREAWIEVDLGEPMTFGRVGIDESCGARIQAFELQRRDGDAWKTFLNGTTAGPDWSRGFEPVTARHVRLNILDATEGPTIWEFNLYPPAWKE